MKILRLLFIAVFVLLQSCKQNNTTTNSTAANQKTNKKSCLLDYQTKLDKLLTTDLVLKATNCSNNVLEVEYINMLKNPEHHVLTYAFENGRKQEYEGYGLQTVKDLVEIKYIKPITLQQFESSYKAMSDEQIAQMNKKLDDAIEEKSEHEEVQEAMDELNMSSEDKEAVKEASQGLTSAFAKVVQGYRNVNNLGDAAKWNIVSNELVVLKNEAQFQLKVDVGDANKNKAIAINIAKQILNVCR